MDLLDSADIVQGKTRHDHAPHKVSGASL
jgi:hypothetical protein